MFGLPHFFDARSADVIDVLFMTQAAKLTPDPYDVQLRELGLVKHEREADIDNLTTLGGAAPECADRIGIGGAAQSGPTVFQKLHRSAGTVERTAPDAAVAFLLSVCAGYQSALGGHGQSQGCATARQCGGD